MTDTTDAPQLSQIARLIEQAIEEGRETRERLDAHMEIAKLQFDGMQQLFEGTRSTATAQFLTLTGALADTQRHVERIEEHVGLLTAKATAHDKRFDTIDARLDAHDKRFDTIDARLDAHDKRFDTIDTRLDALAADVARIVEAVVPRASTEPDAPRS